MKDTLNCAWYSTIFVCCYYITGAIGSRNVPSIAVGMTVGTGIVELAFYRWKNRK